MFLFRLAGALLIGPTLWRRYDKSYLWAICITEIKKASFRQSDIAMLLMTYGDERTVELSPSRIQVAIYTVT